ncbi:hypothetical protein TNCV_2037081 [Trichonephila clavipes]|nr:hypothetical protein TNCV_2037081 [Trichonephila clavipes]
MRVILPTIDQLESSLLALTKIKNYLQNSKYELLEASYPGSPCIIQSPLSILQNKKHNIRQSSIADNIKWGIEECIAVHILKDPLVCSH